MNFQLLRHKAGLPQLLQLFSKILLRNRTVLGRLHRISQNLNLKLSHTHFQPGRFPTDKCGLHPYSQPLFPIYIPLPHLGQINFINAAVGGAVQGHHLPAIVSEIVSVLPLAADIQSGQGFHILFFHLELSLGMLQKPIYIFSIDGGHSCRILRLFHPSLNLKRVYAGPHQFREMFKSTQILQAQWVIFFSVYGPAGALCLIGQPAGLGASSPVAAAAAQNTAEQTCAGITIAHGSVNKCLHFQSAFTFEIFKFFQREFPGGHHPGHSQFRKQRRSPGTGDSHLGAGVKLQFREMPSNHLQCPQVLYNHTVQPCLIEGFQLLHQFCQFLLLHQSVHGEVTFAAVQMSITDTAK